MIKEKKKNWIKIIKNLIKLNPKINFKQKQKLKI